MKRAHIEIDRASLLELARGGNLYSDPFSCVRELVQNAADATLLRLFEERGAAAFPTHEGSIVDLRAALASRPIDVRVEPGDDPREPALRFRIRDRGTGMARADVDYLGTLGASWRNPRRRAAIEAMPEWMRPSGTFGIGIHSVFLVADEVCLRTTHFASGESLSLRLFRDEEGVSLDVDDAEPLEGGGTEVVLELPRKRAAHPGYPEVAAARSLADPLAGTTVDVPLMSARIFARRLGEGTIVPIDVDGVVARAAFDAASTVFDPQSLVELAWVELPADQGRIHSGWRFPPFGSFQRTGLYYRGAPLAHGQRVELPVEVACNVHFGTARALLMLSRDVLSREGKPAVHARAADALRRVAPRWLDASSPRAAPPSVRPWVSRALWLDRQPTAGDAWREADLQEMDDGSTLTLGLLADQGHVRLRSGAKATLELPELGRTADMVYADRRGRADLHRAFGHWRMEDARMDASGAERSPMTFIYRVDRESEGATVAATRTLLRQGDHLLRGTRSFLWRPDGYADLDVDGPRYVREWYGEEPRIPTIDPRAGFPLPYVAAADGVVTVSLLTTWVRAIAKVGRHGPRDPVVVARAAWRFLVHFDDDVRAAPGITARYDLDVLRAELEAEFGIELPAVDPLRAELGLPSRGS